MRGSLELRTVKDKVASLVLGTSWMMVSEVIARLSRVVTLLVFAAYFTPVEYGTAMLALVCHELIRVFSRLGIGAKVIQCDHYELASYAGNAKALQWLVCIGLAGIQLLISGSIAEFYDNAELVLLLNIMAISHLLYPLVTVRVFLLQRQGNMKFFGIASGISIAVDNLSAALLLFLDYGLLSVAYAKVLAAVCWVVLFSFAKVTHYPLHICRHYMPKLASFSSQVLISELLKVGRLQADVLIAGKLLSAELFGLYSFAKSSGVGLSQSLSAGFITSLYPYLSDAQRKSCLSERVPYAVGAGLVISLVFILQAALAPFYIEWLFGAEWLQAVSMVSILCISAISLLMIDVSNTILRVCNKLKSELMLSLICLGFLFIMIVVSSPESAMSLALIVTVSSLLWIPLALGLVFYQVPYRKPSLQESY